MTRLILGMIHNRGMGDNRARPTLHPHDVTRGGSAVHVQKQQQKAGHYTLSSRRAEISTPEQRQSERKMIDECIHFFEATLPEN